MILIASGAYVIPEFQVELGRIPPCLLPIGNKKLLELQVAALNKKFQDDIYLSLPESYEISSSEKKIIESLGVNIVQVPDQFNLCDSLLYILNTNEYLSREENFYLLHGDTYIVDFEKNDLINTISISKSYDSYNWEVVKRTNDYALVWSGFFIFSSISYLLKSLTLNRRNFVDAVKYYGKEYSLKTIECDSWFDLGHSNTYFNSRANITTQRAFNDLNIHNGVVRKQGNPSEKIKAESFWFLNVPNSLKKFIPVLLSHGESNSNYYYELEYLPYIPLNELYVHGKNEVLQWNKILNKISEFITLCQVDSLEDNLKKEINEDVYKLYADKSKDRFYTYTQDQCIDIEKEYIYKNVRLPNLKKILEDCIERTVNMDVIHGIMHGDLCFSNILFDSRGDRIKVIDPRGMNYKSEMTIYGDLKYDYAKLTHSLIGLYDYIISGYYKIEESANGSMEIVFDVDDRVMKIMNQYLLNFRIQSLSVRDIMPLVVLLFFSMLPLHADRPDRQKAMFYNALRLYKEFVFD